MDTSTLISDVTHSAASCTAPTCTECSGAKAARALVLCIGDSATVDMLRRIVPDIDLLQIADTAALVKELEAGTSPAIVFAALAHGESPALQTLAALRAHPQMPRQGLFVQLATPYRAHVVRCGRLGLVNVVAPDADDATLRRRFDAVLAGAPASCRHVS